MDFAVTDAFVASANPGQLHSEARGTKQLWPASFVQTDKGWVYRVDRDDIDRTYVQAAIDAHAPNPDFGKPTEDVEMSKLRDKAKAVAAGTDTFTAAQVQKILAHLVLRATR